MKIKKIKFYTYFFLDKNIKYLKKIKSFIDLFNNLSNEKIYFPENINNFEINFKNINLNFLKDGILIYKNHTKFFMYFLWTFLIFLAIFPVYQIFHFENIFEKNRFTNKKL